MPPISSLTARLTVRLMLVFAVAAALGLALFLMESFDEYRRDFGGRMTEAARILGRSITDKKGETLIDVSAEDTDTLRRIPAFRYAVRRVDGGNALPGSDPVLASTFDTVAADSLRHDSQAFNQLLRTPSGPVEIVMTRGGIGAVDIMEWFAEVGSEMLPAFAIILGGSLLVIAVGIRRDLKPVLRIAAAAERIGPSDIATRLDESDVPVEILPLVRAVNGALGRLEAAFASQRQFTADAAHELRTPIAVLRARVDTMSESNTSKALRKDLDRLARLAEQLLTVSVLDSRAFDLDVDVDVGAMTRGVVAELAPLAVARDRNLAFEGPDCPVFVSGNAAALEEGVRNLIENALRHSPSGEVVDVAVRANGTIEVMDRGPGIPPHHREMIFRRFWRGTAVDHQGAGLGLPIVRHIAEAHGGSVHVDSREEGGAVFRIELPVQR